MEIYGYTLIAAVPSFLFLIICFVIIIINWRRNGKLSDLVDFVVLNGFPAILKTKKDERNQTLVYMRKGKVLLQGETLDKVKKALFMIFWSIIVFVISGFGQFAFIEYSYNCEASDQGKDCFEYPITTAFDAVRANCSDPDILQGKKLVLCYRLVFQFELAVGVSYGMYKICTVLLSIASALIIKLNKKHIKCFQIVVSIVTCAILVALFVLLLVFQSHPSVMTFGFSKIKLSLNIFGGIITSICFINLMPWVKIIEEKNRANAETQPENSGAEESVQSRQTSVQEIGMDNPTSATSS